ncbi:MAG: DUF1631 family protein [Oceanococcus sp.]
MSRFKAALKGSPELDRLKSDALEQLRGLVARELSPVLTRFIEQTQVLLLRPDSADHNNADIRKNAEVARKMKQQAEQWKAGLLRHIEQRVFHAEAAPNFADHSETERANASLIAMAKALLIAETKYFKRIAEIDARMNRVRLIVDLGIDNKALAPTGLHQALVATADDMDWPRGARKLLYSSFEANVINQLDPLYDCLVEASRGIGREAAQLIVESTFDLSDLDETEQEQKAQQEPRQWMSVPKEAHSLPAAVDGKTTAMLTTLALQDEGEGYSDGLLAADLLALMDRRPLPGLTGESGDLSVQRTSLAGHFLNEVTADPMVDKTNKAQHEPLRMPLVKSAIADSTMFTDVSHPLSSLIDDHLTRAARHRLQNVEEAQEMEDSLGEVLSLFELAPDFVRESMSQVQPLQDDQIERFYELQRQQAGQRREFVINEAKRLVAEELERSCFARNVPAPAQRFLQKAWSALLTQRLLKFGASAAQWKAGIQKMDALIELLEERDPASRPTPDWVNLIKGMAEDLVKGGLPVDQRGNIIKMLEAARKTA